MKYLFIFTLFLLISCSDNKNKQNKPIVFDDSSLIVHESNPAFLKNVTQDISPTNKKSSESQIRKMMVQVDSLKSTQKLNQEGSSEVNFNGFTINFKECDVIFRNLQAHAIQNTQDERKLNSVSYVKDEGEFLEMQLAIDGLTDLKVEQRFFTKLSVEFRGESLMLSDLGKFSTPWYNLIGKGNKFISMSANGLQYAQIDNAKLKSALNKELHKKKKNKLETIDWLNSIQRTKNYTDAPCKVNITSAQWRIWGKKDNKVIQKLIQFDVP